MKICFLSTEIFAWGKYGGFGRATRKIAGELVKRGYEVSAVVPKRENQKSVEYLDGIKVYGFCRFNPLSAFFCIKKADADIYHSQEPSFLTYLAMKAMPHKKHVITFRDTKDKKGWEIELRNPSLNKLQVLSNILFEDNFLTGKAVKEADGIFGASRCISLTAQGKYRLRHLPDLLPTPVRMKPDAVKATEPTVCFIGRLDRRKNPESFFELVKFFPKVRFIAVGRSRDYKYGESLAKKYSLLPNLEFAGFIDQFNSGRLSEILEKSWIIVNTSLREGLPNSFIEAAAHKCAILSSPNPDDFASKFGYWVKDGDFKKGLEWLLENNRWQKLGAHGYQYVESWYENNMAIDKHIEVYKTLL